MAAKYSSDAMSERPGVTGWLCAAATRVQASRSSAPGALLSAVCQEGARGPVLLVEGLLWTLVNTVRLDSDGLEALDALGTVKNIVRLGGCCPLTGAPC